MYIVPFYIVLLFLFSEILYKSCAMVDRSEKQISTRSDRQFRPVLNSIIFLLAANLVAKGALALGGYQSPTLPNNVQGSLFLALNGPQSQGPSQQYVPIWYPISNQIPYPPLGTSTQRPITQQQIVNIREPIYEDSFEDNYQQEKEIQKFIINRHNNIDKIIPSSSEEKQVKIRAENPLKNTTESTETVTELEENYDDNVENITQSDNVTEDSIETGRQQLNDTTSKTTTTTTTVADLPTTLFPSSTTTLRATTSRRPTNQLINNGTSSNMTTPGSYYGQSKLNQTISFTYAPPVNNDTTGNLSEDLQPPGGNKTNNTNTGGVYGPPSNNNGYYYYPALNYGPPTGYEYIPNIYGYQGNQYPGNDLNNTTNNHGKYEAPSTNNGYHYFPSGNYGPSNGHENISITYGPPVYKKPFFSSPEDPYLNRYNQYYNNFYERPSYYPEFYYKYGDIFNKFYKYNYPSFYNNYLGK